MKITERRLRQVIRQIIKEQFHDHNFSKSDMQLIGKVGVGFFIANFAVAAIGGMVTIYDIVANSSAAENCKMIDGNESYTLEDVDRDQFEDFAQDFEGESVNISIVDDSLVLENESGGKLQLTFKSQDKNYRIKLAECVASAIVGKKLNIKRALAYGTPLKSEQIRLIQQISGLDRASAAGFKF